LLSFNYDYQVNHNTVQKFVGGKFWLCGSFGLISGNDCVGAFP
jgi:hypothetical protein